MKIRKIYGCAIILCLSTLVGCMNFYENRVESDYSYNGNFKRYKTFNFMGYKKTDSDSSNHMEIVENAIRARMQLQGYRFSENKPDLLVSHKIFYDDLLFKGYNQTEIDVWLASGKVVEEEIDEETGEQKKEYDPVRYNLTKGTLLVVLIDRKHNRAIWQGYASGLLGNKDFNNEGYLKRSVRSIFDKYKVFTEGYLMTNGQQPARTE
ncbi:DUF4136 domain-containing protein [Adhaeribacter aerolatus]|nr:DUF4136 domain-containing protein [Adhaeribacter aerolatus]